MTTTEFEIRLYEPRARWPLYFTRAATAGAAHALARRWQGARPDCRVLVVATTATRPMALTADYPIAG